MGRRTKGKRFDMSGRRAVVTGASSGLGVAFARHLASWGASVVITARRKERLDALAAELRADYGVEIEVVPLDLSQNDAPASLLATTTSDGRAVDLLVNNAGLGYYSAFAEQPWEQHAQTLRLDVAVSTELTWRFGRHMLDSGAPGHILNVASMAAYQPVPKFAVYGASKSFIRDFSEAVAYELRETPVRVCVLCPGGVDTEFFEVSGQTIEGLAKRTMMTPERCAGLGLRALLKGRRAVVPGALNNVATFVTRFLPRRLTARSAASLLGSAGGTDRPGDTGPGSTR